MTAVRRSADVAALAVLGVLVVALLAIWRMALHTPFRLIDDYLDWRTAAMFHPLQYLRDLALNFSGARYRPVNDLGNALAWKVFSSHFALHHAWRLAVKVVTFLFFWRTIRAVSRPLVARASLLGVPLLTFAFALYFFFPNNPEARLAPQELASAFGFFWFTWSLVEATVATRLGYLSALASFTVFCLAKEPNVIAALGLLAWLAWELSRGGGRRWWTRIVPFVAVLAHTGLKVAAAMGAADYGNAPLSLGLIARNLRFAGRVLLLPFASPWLVVVLAGPLLLLAKPAVAQLRTLRSRDRSSAGPATLPFLGLATGFLLLAFLTSWIPTLRYAYPATIAWLALDCAGAAVLADRIAARWTETRAAFALVVVAFLFAAVNAHNVASQFASQLTAGRSEQRLLALTGELLAGGATVGVPQETEFEWSIAVYFNEFLPSVATRRYAVATQPASIAQARYLISRSPAVAGWIQETVIVPEPAPRLVQHLRPVAAALQLRWPDPYVFLDTGAQPVAYFPWYVHGNVGERAAGEPEGAP